MASEKLNMQIRLLRTALNYSQEELAKAVGVSDVTISKWESGRSPNSKHIPLLARALKCSETELLHGCKQQNPLPVEFSMNKKPMFSERLLSRMAMLELKSNDVAKAMHVSRGTVSQWVNGIAKPGGENAAHLAMILSCNIAWLMNGDGSVDDDAAMSTRQTHESVPLVLWQELGEWLNYGSELSIRERIRHATTVGKRAFALRMQGDSMVRPSGCCIPDNALMIVDPDTHAVNGSIVVVLSDNQVSVAVKELVLDCEITYLRAFNTDYRLQVLQSNTVIVGVIKQVIQNM